MTPPKIVPGGQGMTLYGEGIVDRYPIATLLVLFTVRGGLLWAETGSDRSSHLSGIPRI